MRKSYRSVLSKGLESFFLPVVLTATDLSRAGSTPTPLHPVCSTPWWTSRALVPPGSRHLQPIHPSLSQLYAMSYLGLHAGTLLPHTWTLAFISWERRFHNPVPLCPSWFWSQNNVVMLPSSSACLGWNLVPSLNYICIKFPLLFLI